MFTIALSTVPTMVVVLVGILISNIRLGDVRDVLRAEMKTVEAHIEKNRARCCIGSQSSTRGLHESRMGLG